MSDDAATVAVLTRVPTEFEAALVVTHLAEQGIQAEAVGGYTAGFRAQAPGDIKILVRAGNMEKARQILNELREPIADVDWTQVDVGEPE